MDRDKASRKTSLEELRRLRKEGGTHFHSADVDALMECDGEGIAGDQSGSDYGDAEDLHDFIEDAEPRSRNGLPTKRDAPTQHRVLANFFKRKPGSGPAPSAIKPDDNQSDSYLKSLMQQLDDDEESSSEDSGEDSAPQQEAPSQLDPVPTDINEPQSFAPPPSEMFAPLDQNVLNAEVIKTLEEEDWDDGEFDSMLEAVDPKAQREMETLVDFMEKENVTHVIPQSTNMVPMEIDTSAPTISRTDYTPPEDGSVDFYWIDAYEKPNNGVVYLFGKVRQPDGAFASCCLTVNNIQRNVFFLPRECMADDDEEEVTIAALHAEIAEVMAKYKIAKYGCKTVERKYAFEVADIPSEADWIKVVYGFNFSQLPQNLSGRTFSHVFGTNTSALELLLMKRKMMGPSWIRIKPSNSGKQNISWCKAELTVDNPKTDIQVILNGPEAPPLTVMSLSLRTCLNSSQQHEIISASALVFNSVSPDSSSTAETKCNSMFSVVRDPEGLGFSAKFTESLQKGYNTKLEIAKNERALLGFLITMLHRHDPDVLVGHNFNGFDLGVLLHRMKACKVDFWSRLGRLNWSQWPKSKGSSSTEASFAERQIVSGRIVCDTWQVAKEHVRAKNYSLNTLVEQVLGQKVPDHDEALDVFGDPSKIKRLAQSPDMLMKLLRQAEMSAYHQAMLMFRLMILPLTKQLTNIAGNLWSRTLSGARAERNEFLLLHEFHQAKYICPDRTMPFSKVVHQEEEPNDADDEPKKAGGGRRKPAYAGGLVLEPKRGFYDKIVLLLDFNSLYPSIIQEYNICFTTVIRDPSNSDESLPDLPDSSLKQGVLPRVLKSLVEKRAAVKRNMKDPKTPPALLAQYNIRQQALKLTANSMYGCLGFSHSRFYAKPLAMLITSRGRDILQSTVQLAQQQCHLDVVYGDTDSIMIHTGCTDLAQAKRLAQQVKRAVNERYKLLEIELDGVFEKLLLLRKKKYAALILEEKSDPVTGRTELVRKLETKGLDMVRRDWCSLSNQASDYILQQMMFGSGNSEEVVAQIHTYLTDLAAKASAGDIPIEQFIINKNLTKDPEAYADIKSQPHVVVAQRMKQRGLSAHAGDTIPYVICATESSLLSERAFHPDELRSNPSLAIDVTWYLAQQIHPPIARLCECVVGTDAGRLAQCLGLDARKYASHSSASGNTNEDGESTRLMSFLSDEEKFRDVRKLELTCNQCRVPFTFTAPLRIDANGDAVSGFACPACQATLTPTSVYCQTLALIRACIAAYHLFWLECDEPACKAQTRRMRVYETRCINDTCRGSMRPKIPGSQMYHQLLYLRGLFDWDKAKAQLASAGGDVHVLRSLQSEYDSVRLMILHQLNQCSYPIINLREVFSFMTVKPEKT